MRTYVQKDRCHPNQRYHFKGDFKFGCAEMTGLRLKDRPYMLAKDPKDPFLVVAGQRQWGRTVPRKFKPARLLHIYSLRTLLFDYEGEA